jgi:hypothetical protein
VREWPGSLAAALALGLLAFALAPPEAGAHGRSNSTSLWELEPGPMPAGRVLVRVRLSDLQRVLREVAGLTAFGIQLRPDATAAVDAYLTRHVALLAGESRCSVKGPVRGVPSADPTHLARSWRVQCLEAGPPVLRIDPFFEAAPGHFHLARATLGDGSQVERVFVLESPVFPLTAREASGGEAGAGFGDYLRLGIEHIATGADHLVFVLALLLVGASLAEVATIVTGFTVAHSVTLALGVLGVVEPLSAAIEALIGLSIVVVTLENFAITVGPSTRRAIVASLGGGVALAALASAAGFVAVPALTLIGVGVFALAYLGLLRHVERPGRLRWFVAFVFGLVHGFGFAGMLAEIGLPPGRVAAALFGFNLGVELGQLAVVAAVWPILHLAMRGGPERRRRLVHVGSVPILVAGLFWFLTRAVG